MAGAAAIRPARPDEAQQVLALWQEADATPSPTDTRDEVMKLLGEPAAVLLVAEAGGRLVGTVIGGWDGWRGNIYRLAVLPAYRRRGIARALVESDHPWATDFWDSLGASGYRHDERMRRYVKTL